MAFQSNAGKKVYISDDIPATNDLAGFEAVTMVWTEILGVTSANGLGRTNNEASILPLSERMPIRDKGSYDYAPLTCEMGFDSQGAGQALAIAANESDATYSVKVVYKNGEIDYAQGLVMGFDIAGGGVDDIITATMTFQAQKDVVRDYTI